MRRLSFFIIFVLFLLPIATASTTKYTKMGATILRTDDDFTTFKNAVYTSFPECHNGKYNATYKTYSRILDMTCHIEWNNTVKKDWTQGIIHFDYHDNKMNKTVSAIIHNNNSIVQTDQLIIVITNNVSDNWINMPMELKIGTCNQNISTPRLNKNFDTPTKLIMNNSYVAKFNVHSNGNLVATSSQKNTGSFQCNTELYNTHFNNAFYAGQAYSGFGGSGGTSSYIKNARTVTSYTSSDNIGGGLAVENMEDFTWLHSKSWYCFIPTGSNLANTTLKGGTLECGEGLFFAFSANAQADLIDVKADTFSSDGFLAILNASVYYTFNADLVNAEGKPVTADYSFQDTVGLKYAGKTDKIRETIFHSNYFYSDATGLRTTFHMPLTVNITNSSYINIINHEFNMTEQNKGIMAMLNSTDCDTVMINGFCATSGLIGWQKEANNDCIGWQCNKTFVGWGA